MSEYYTCPKCGKTSWHPVDASEQYCSNCHTFARDLPPERTADGEDDRPDGVAQTHHML